MKKGIITILFIAGVLLSSCSKDEGTTPEANIAFDTDASLSNISLGNNFSFNIKLTSAMPAQGIKIEVSAAEEMAGTGVNPQPPAITSTAITTATNVTNLPKQKWVLVSVKVTSVSTVTNTLSKTFRVVYK